VGPLLNLRWGIGDPGHVPELATFKDDKTVHGCQNYYSYFPNAAPFDVNSVCAVMPKNTIPASIGEWQKTGNLHNVISGGKFDLPVGASMELTIGSH